MTRTIHILLWMAFAYAIGWFTCPWAWGDVTLRNYMDAQSTAAFQISPTDDRFNQVDAHDGSIIEATTSAPCTTPGVGGCYFWKIGTSYGCGYIWEKNSPFCGFNVYRSTDMVHWTYVGQLFDPTTPAWQAECAGVDGLINYCGSSKMIYNASTGKFVWWAGSYVASTTDAGYIVMVCDTPAGPCTGPTKPHRNSAGKPGADFGLMVDGGVAYQNYNTNYELYVDRLNAAYTDYTGTGIDTGFAGEGNDIFKNGSTYYITYGSGCGFCSAGAPLSYLSASSPLGTWSSGGQISPASACQAQPRHVAIVTASGTTTLVQVGDQWVGASGNGIANEYYQPLSFTGAAINAYTCQSTVTLPGLTADSGPTLSGADQSSVPGTFLMPTNGAVPFIAGGQWRMQTFVANDPALDSVFLLLAAACNAGNGNCAGMGGNPAYVSLVTVDGSNNPVTTLKQVTVPATNIYWSGTWTRVQFSYTGLTPGTTYGIVVNVPVTAGSGFTAGLYTYTSGGPYSAGVERYSNNSGASWSTEPGAALMFATYSSPPPVIEPPPVVTVAARGLRMR